jgi:hypothetical protein
VQNGSASHEDNDRHDRVVRHRDRRVHDACHGCSGPERPLKQSIEPRKRNNTMTTLTFVIHVSALAITWAVAFAVMSIG